MNISAISIFTADLPLTQPFQHASSGLIDRLLEVVVKIETEEGAIGYGEVRGNAPYVTGETQGRVIASLTEALAPRLVALGPTSPAEIVRLMDRIVPGNTTAKAAVDIAVHDAAAKAAGIPVRQFLGGGERAQIRIHGTLPFCPPDEAARRVTAYLDQGLRTIKVRVGQRLFETDLARLDAVRAALAEHSAGREARVAVDANQAWTAKEAIRNLRSLEDRNLAWAEQPVPAHDVAGLMEVRDAVTAPIVADEACATPEDVLRLVEARAADAFHFKLCKAGGVRKLMAMVAIAEAAGLEYIIGQMDEGMLATAAGLHCAAASAPLSCELWGYQRVGRQPFSGLEMRGGAIRLPETPGLGVAVDEAGLVLVQRIGTPA